MQNLSFEVRDYGEGPEGQFIWGHERGILFDKFYQTMEIIESGDTQKALNQLRSIIKKDPEFIDAYNSFGAYFYEKGNPRKRLEYYSKAYQIGQRVIPNAFTGRIPWIQLENRPFLRSMHGLGLCYIYEMQRDKAIDLFERLLRYNPNDNQGVRCIIGDLYLQNKDHQAADNYFKDNLDYPPYRYSYGLSLFMQGFYIESIVQFWMGFYKNIYILEHILDHYPIIKYDFYHSSSDEKPEIASQYYGLNLGMWTDKYIKEFLRMIYECPDVQLGIQGVYNLKSCLNFIRKSSTDEMIKQRTKVIDYIKRLKRKVNKEAANRIYNDMKKDFLKRQ